MFPAVWLQLTPPLTPLPPLTHVNTDWTREASCAISSQKGLGGVQLWWGGPSGEHDRTLCLLSVSDYGGGPDTRCDLGAPANHPCWRWWWSYDSPAQTLSDSHLASLCHSQHRPLIMINTWELEDIKDDKWQLLILINNFLTAQQTMKWKSFTPYSLIIKPSLLFAWFNLKIFIIHESPYL